MLLLFLLLKFLFFEILLLQILYILKSIIQYVLRISNCVYDIFRTEYTRDEIWFVCVYLLSFVRLICDLLALEIRSLSVLIPTRLLE